MGRVLSSIGVGSATVDTVLPSGEVQPGETVDASVELTGGDSTQSIDGIYFALKARVDGLEGTDERVLAEPSLDRSITLSPDDERSVPVELEVPPWTPLSRGDAEVWLETGLDIAWARDPSDEDRLRVVPCPITEALFEAIAQLGFEYHHATIVDTPYIDGRPFAQVFDFRPTDDDLATRVDKLDVTIMPREADLRTFLEVVRRDRVADAYDLALNEQETSITFDRADPGMLRRRIRNEIDRYA